MNFRITKETGQPVRRRGVIHHVPNPRKRATTPYAMTMNPTPAADATTGGT
ncbi:hypothetical protein [Segatella baroniae]|uniref:hypothetical protein n=1 Tax=Segatella baroniae TaxID=305719 RepID=UPI00040396D0|nr:hypothetical protein [Segatella baroniae]